MAHSARLRARRAVSEYNITRRRAWRLIDALAVLDAERTRAAANLALAPQRSQISLDQVGVFFALGGGWRGPGEAAER
jgi:outer membrane protein TolC